MIWLALTEAEPSVIQPALVGGKALGLYWLQRQGYPIPPSWVLTTAAFDTIVQAARVAEHVAVLERATAGQPDWASTERSLRALEVVRGELTEALRNAPLPNGMQEAVKSLPQDEAYWAVRSSATVEDSSAHSFAGQFKSFLSVPRGPRLMEAVRAVWSSTFDKTVLHYRAQHGTAMPRMAVLLQPMPPIRAKDRAGVAFSKSTIPGLSGVLLQTTFGAGLTVVGGGGGELKCVDGSQVTTHVLAPSQLMVTAAGGGLQTMPAQMGPVLSDTEALQLARQVEEIARRYGRPVDIEFVWRDGEDPVFVQVRAITS